MSRFHRLFGALTLALFLTAVAAADDAKEVQNYVLTDAGLAKYSQAARRMAVMDAAQTGACDESEDDDDSQSISEVAAKLDRYPAAKNTIEEAGMTTREYVVFSFALLQTGLAVWGAEQSGGKATVSAANVAFYKKNEAFLKKLDTITQPKFCEEEEDDGEDGESGE